MDLEDTMSVKETSAQLHISSKTVYRWVETGKLPAVKVGLQLFIKRDAVEAIASGRGVYIDNIVQRIEAIEQRLNSLIEIENRLNRLETMIETLTNRPGVTTSPPPMKAPSRSSQRHEISQPKGLPANAVLASAFAREHGVNERTFADHCKRGIGPEKETAPVSSRPKPGREARGEIEYYLMPEQVADVLAYWRRYGVKFT